MQSWTKIWKVSTALPAWTSVSARARHPEGVRAADSTAGNHVGKMCAEETCWERGGPGLGAKHAGSSAPRGAVHLAADSAEEMSQQLWVILILHVKSLHT